MKLISTALIAGCMIVAFSASSSLAGKKPRGSKSPGASVIKAKYVGKTWKWKNGDGIYFARNGTTMATYQNEVAFGKWSVSSAGTLCNTAKWHWDDKGPKNRNIKTCWKHTLDKDGDLWARESKKNNWYEFSSNKFSRGNRVKSKINRVKKKLGL